MGKLYEAVEQRWGKDAAVQFRARVEKAVNKSARETDITLEGDRAVLRQKGEAAGQFVKDNEQWKLDTASYAKSQGGFENYNDGQKFSTLDIFKLVGQVRAGECTLAVVEEKLGLRG